MVDGLTVMLHTIHSRSMMTLIHAYALTYAGIEGLSVSYGKGSNDESAT